MQDEVRYSNWSMATFLAWIATAMLTAGAWGTWLIADRPWTAILVAETACVISAIAAVLQIRCFCSRLARTIRRTALARAGEAAEVRPLR